jgi:hypothetical protein
MTRREDLVALRDALGLVLSCDDKGVIDLRLQTHVDLRRTLEALIAQEPAPMTPVKDRGMHE